MIKSVIGIVGLVLIIIGNLTIYKSKSIRKKWTYPLLILGGICMTIYSVFLNDVIFIILQVFFVLVSVYGLIKIHQKVKRKR